MNHILDKDRLSNEYFEWMYNFICGDNLYQRLSYRKLLMFLHGKEFTYTVDRDGNRVSDAIHFRYKFGYENGYTNDEIEKCLGDGPCSILELMVSLSFIIEDRIMNNTEEGDRTGLWFWNMIVNLGLGTMSDNNFDRDYCEFVVDRFLNRQYDKDGKGGLFRIRDDRDMRTAEIWYQAMWYLNYFDE
jgi:hypothetical protein